MRPFLLILILLSLSILNSYSQAPGETRKKISSAVEARNYPEAIEFLQKLRQEEPKEFISQNYDYLLARMSESQGDLASAMSSYQAVADRKSILKPWALMHLAGLARSTGNLMLERLYLRELGSLPEKDLPAGGATIRAARNSFDQANYAETIRQLTTVSGVTRTGKDSRSREYLALLAESYLRAGNAEAARSILTELINTIPNPTQPDDVALKAVRGLDLLDVGSENVGRKVPDLPEADQYKRGMIYQSNRDFAAAKLHFEILIANFPSGTSAADAAFQIGRGFAQSIDYVHALEWFERVMERNPQSTAAKDALLQAAGAYSRVGKHKEAIKRYQSFIDKYPTDDKLDRAYLNIVDILRDQSEDNEALRWCAKTESAFKGKAAEAISVFTEARIYIVRGEWENSLRSLDRAKGYSDLGGPNVPGGTSAAEINFMRAYVLEQLNRFPEAIDTYLSIGTGRGEYYGWRATDRLAELRATEASRSFIDARVGSYSAGLNSNNPDQRRTSAMALLRLTDVVEVRENALNVLKSASQLAPDHSAIPALKITDKISAASGPESSRHPAIADAMASLGLYDEAAPEFEAADPDALKRVDDRAYTLATYYSRGDRSDRGIAFIEPLWRKVPAEYPVDLMPRDQLELLYPAPYTAYLTKYAAASGVDPRLLLSIMRQESRFQPDAKSYSAARGLMQFTSTTSTPVSQELGRGTFDQDELYYPPTAIQFGSRYLADLFKAFPGQPDAVIASYNGGDDNMKRWLARSRSNLPERYVPEILYAQSKDYVYKVMSNYRMYQYLYDEQLRPK